MSNPPMWFSPDWRAIYARALAEILKLEKLAREAGREIRPREKRQ